ncbi:MAG TPA: hypothetical protein VG407_02305 [Caulobacteraceae bacterium]|nr:hypothetical protein [Caulobacteraceae bacterium]
MERRAHHAWCDDGGGPGNDEHLRAADFWSLAPAYRSSITDQTEQRLTLRISEQSKMVIDYSGRRVGMPWTVIALEDAVDRAAGDWVTGGPRRGARADKFATERSRLAPSWLD